MKKQNSFLKYLSALLLLPTVVWAQNYPKLSITETKPATKYYRQYAASVEQEAIYQVQASSSFTSLAFRATSGTDWTDTYLIVNQDTFRVSVEEHETANLHYSLSTLLVWDKQNQ